MDQKLKDRILTEMEIINGKKKLTCSKAFKISLELDISLKEICEFCNKEEIKIYACQLGCF